MMKPIEKAKELMNKFRGYADDSMASLNDNARYCSLLCVDEAQELLNKPMFQYKESMLWKAEFEYWDKVRDELNGL